MGYRGENSLAAAAEISERVIGEALHGGRYRGWLIADPSGRVVAGGGIILLEHHAGPSDPTPLRPVIVNVYTEAAYRGRGLARALMNQAVAWCREQGLHRVFLHASPQGRPLYESMGFRSTPEMRLDLTPPREDGSRPPRAAGKR